MEWTDTALVLRVGKFKETDLWVRLLTRQRGVLTAFAFGGSRSRRRFTGCLDSFNIITVHATTSRNGAFLNLEEATLLFGPSRLRRDWQRQGMLANCTRFLEAVLDQGQSDGADNLFELMRELLELLEHSPQVPGLLPQLFRFRVAAEQGYAPDLTTCYRCGKNLDEKAFFLVAEGVTSCGQCHPVSGMTLALGRESLDVLCKVQENFSFWQNSTVEPETWRQCGRMIDAFVRYHLGLEWRNGRFQRL